MEKINIYERLKSMNISFGANLIVDKNFGKNTPPYIDKENLLKVKDEYKKLLSEDIIIDALTEGDTVELSTKKEKDGYYIYLDFKEKENLKPYTTFYGIGKDSSAQFNIDTLKTLTLKFIADKSGIQKEGRVLSYPEYIKEGVLTYAKQYIDKKHKKD